MGFEQEFPRSGKVADLTKVNIVASELLQQHLNPREATYIEKGGELYDWSFIGFTDIQESISHTWEPYGSIQGRMSQKVTAVKESAGKLINAFTSMNTMSKSSAGFVSAALASGTTDAAKYKVDTPLVYTGSQRRQISFTFTLMEWTDAFNDVLSPIHEFRRYSCASIADSSIDMVKFPAIFSVQTSPQSFVDIKDCALTDVQVTWNSPHTFGNPMRAELTVTFLDLRPLYRSSWGESNGAISSSVEGIAVNAPQRIAHGQGL